MDEDDVDFGYGGGPEGGTCGADGPGSAGRHGFNRDDACATKMCPLWEGAPLKGSMCVGQACVTAPVLYFDSTGLENLDFERYPFQTSGCFGNVPFDGRFTVVLDLPHRRFGVMAGSAR
jgi:hypothetical protein